MNFEYKEAFSRNIGWLTSLEQEQLKTKRIAIAGMGGAGGEHLITMARLGVENFHISDLDTFEIGNFNRQTGASMDTIHQEKSKVLAQQAKAINPNIKITSFNDGINKENVVAFLKDIDLYLDGLDLYAPLARSLIFAQCTAFNIPAITAAPIGMGTAMLCFMPGKMTFQEYFGVENKSELEQSMRLIIGITTARYHLKYMVEMEGFDFIAKKSPSTAMGIKLCAGILCTQALKILLGRGKVLAAPRGMHFDAYTNNFKRTYLPLGHKNPLFRLALPILKKKVMGKNNN